jgi:acyl carrier protein
MADDPLASLVLDSFHEISGIHPSRVEPSRHFFEYGVDFVLLIDLVALLEDRLGVDIPNEVLDQLKCVDDVVRYVRRANEMGRLDTPPAFTGPRLITETRAPHAASDPRCLPTHEGQSSREQALDPRRELMARARCASTERFRASCWTHLMSRLGGTRYCRRKVLIKHRPSRRAKACRQSRLPTEAKFNGFCGASLVHDSDSYWNDCRSLQQLGKWRLRKR